jgi:phosphatidylethanolamine-binding protein (PEBP) family uncharacterized protein
MKINAVMPLILICLLMGCSKEVPVPTPETAAFDVISASIDDSGYFSEAQIARSSGGANQSPALTWEKAPNAAGYVVIMYDKTAGWLHWVYPTDKTTLEEGSDLITYVGPYPPKGSGVHEYQIDVYAVRDLPPQIELKNDAHLPYNEVFSAVERSSEILSKGSVLGKWEN